jgi:ribosomal protein S18 acetylase RimI-like enzyme
MFRVVPADTPELIAQVHDLIKEYSGSLGIDLCFEGIEKELTELPGEYAPPTGRLLAAVTGGRADGCVALRKVTDQICELRRLYVRPNLRGHGAGRALVQELIDEAKKIGYRKMRLDTLASMSEAILLYRSLGFYDIHPYRHIPVADAKYMEKELDARVL